MVSDLTDILDLLFEVVRGPNALKHQSRKHDSISFEWLTWITRNLFYSLAQGA